MVMLAHRVNARYLPRYFQDISPVRTALPICLLVSSFSLSKVILTFHELQHWYTNAGVVLWAVKLNLYLTICDYQYRTLYPVVQIEYSIYIS